MQEKALTRADDTFATPVGHGWSFFLNRTPPSGPRIFLHAWKGEEPGRPNSFRSGTTISQMLKVLKKRNLTLASTPSHGTISLGGWIGGSAHGSGGTQWSPTIAGGVVFDQSTGSITEYNDAKTFKQQIELGREFYPNKLIILSVKVLPVSNCWVQLKAFKHETISDCKRWLGTDSPATESRLRCTFVGARGMNLFTRTCPFRTQPPLVASREFNDVMVRF